MKLRSICKSKIIGAKVTDANLLYKGSVGIDIEWMDGAGIEEGEKILIVNLTNGKRFESYAIPEKRGSKKIIMNGGTVYHAKIGDVIAILAFVLTDEKVETKVVTLGDYK